MTTLTLLQLDSKKLQFWFAKHAGAKILIGSLTTLLALGFSGIMYQVSYYYFLGISLYEPYGTATVGYVIHSALLITIWFAIISSIISCLSVLLQSSSEFTYIQTLPVSKSALTTWFILRSSVVTFFILCLLWLPTLVAVLRVFPTTSLLVTFSGLLLTIIILTLTIESVGKTIGLLLAPLISKQKNLFSLLGVTGFILCTFLLLRMLFPPTLQLIRLSTDEDFFTLFSRLPLNQGWAVTSSPSLFLFSHRLSDLVPLFSIALLIILIGWLIVRTVLISTIESARTFGTHSIAFAPHLKRSFTRHPLLTKEVLSVWRVNSERSFIFFFCGMLLFFFYFLRRALTTNPTLLPSFPIVIEFSLGTIFFFTMALSLRIIFPLTSREGQSAWYFLSSPFSRYQHFLTKGKAAILITLPFTVLAALGWMFLPLGGNSFTLAFLTVVGSVMIYGLNWIAGSLFPDWSLGDSPDELSTSSAGLLTLFFSLSIVLLMVVTYKVSRVGSSFEDIGATGMFWILVLLFLFKIFKKTQSHTKKYQYPDEF